MSRAEMVSNRASKQIGLASIAVLLLAGLCFSQTVSVSPKSGPPTLNTLVSGSGFPPNAAIDIYFDAADEALVFANGSGSFSNIAIPAPASALPGMHWVSAVQHSGDAGAQAQFLVRTNWAQVGSTANGRRWNPYENVLSQTTAPGMDLKWTYATGGAVTSSPAVANGVVYVGSSDNNVYAVNATTGKKLWSYTTGGPVTSSPAVANGVVYVGSNDENLYALNASTGAVVWSIPTFGAVGSSPSVANGVVYIGFYAGVFAANASTGAILWINDASDSAVNSSLAVANGMVYFGAGGALYGLNANSGTQVWSGEYDTSLTSPAEAYGLVYVGDNDGMCAQNATTGTGGGWCGGPADRASSYAVAVANGIAYFGGADDVVALNATTGATLWTYPTEGAVTSSPAVANGVVYIGSADSHVYALNATTGALLWSYSTANIVASSPAVANGMVFVGSDDNNVYAFGLSNDGDKNQSGQRPDPKTLRPDLNLKPSLPVTILPSIEND